MCSLRRRMEMARRFLLDEDIDTANDLVVDIQGHEFYIALVQKSSEPHSILTASLYKDYVNMFVHLLEEMEEILATEYDIDHGSAEETWLDKVRSALRAWRMLMGEPL